MKYTPYHTSPMPNTSGIHFPQISLVFQLSTSLFRPIDNPFPISVIYICHLSSPSISTSFLISTISPPYTTPLCHFSSFFIPASTLTSSSFFSTKGSAMPWGSFVIPAHGLWVGGGGRKGGGKRQFLKELALCLWRQKNYRSRTARRWVPGRKLAG